MLGKKVDRHGSKIFQINTGWIGGEYGVGNRIDLGYTRAMVLAALGGELNNTETVQDPVFGFHIPLSCKGVPSEILQPVQTWENPNVYKVKAQELAKKFKENFKRFTDTPSEIQQAGPI